MWHCVLCKRSREIESLADQGAPIVVYHGGSNLMRFLIMSCVLAVAMAPSLPGETTGKARAASPAILKVEEVVVPGA